MSTALGAPLALFLVLAPLSSPIVAGGGVQEQAATPAAEGARVEDLESHYERVERELRAADPVLPEAVAARRAQAIEWLREYRLNARFGVNADFPGERKPYFVDEAGRHCAVAWMLHRDGRDELVARVRTSANHAWLVELAGDAELLAWLDSVGLDSREAARIQAPTGPWMPRGGPWNGGGDRPSSPQGRGRPAGPSTPGPSGPETPGPSGPDRPAGPATPRPTPSGAPTIAGGGPATSGDVGPEAWWTWWQLHKLDYLRPNLLRNWLTTITGWAEDGTPHDGALDRVRAELRPSIERALASGDARLRGAAVLTLGRLAGEDAVDELRAALDDPSLDVRERALLALGATGSMEAAALLLETARHGSPDGARASAVCADARALAVIALAIGRRSGMDERVDLELARIALELDARDETLMQASLLLYQTLAPTPALSAWVLRRAADDETHHGVRCRALETLRTRDDDEALAVLTEELSGRAIERRRSAALALGEFENELALPALMTAAELEREPLTRGFVLISVGRQGGERARELLVEELTEGRKDTRSWCALALGILARTDDHAAARAALRAATAKVKDKGAIGAYYLALGIARDAASDELLREALVDGATPEIRSVAAVGLAMIDTPAGRAALRERLTADSCSFTRAEIAQALGYLGDARDTEALLFALGDLKDPTLRSTTAMALGLHGTRPSVEGLIGFATDPATPDAVRASSLESLQLVLGTSPSLTLGELLRQANFSMFPPTLVRLREVLL